MRVHDAEVVVIGGGPAGLVATATLARFGVRCVLVERHRTPRPVPKATLVSLRTMELLRTWDLEASVRAGGCDVVLRMAVTTSLADLGHHEVVDVGVPTVEQSRVLSPTAPACVPQDHLEAVLLERVRRLPGVVVVAGADAVVERTDGLGARVRITNRDAGAASVLEVPYVIAADGAHSTTRRTLGVGSFATASLHDSITFVVRAPLWELVGPHRYLLYAIGGGSTAGTFLPAGAGDRWVYGAEWNPAAEELSDYSPARVRAMVREAAGVSALAVDVERLGAFSFVAELADTFRAGNVFFVGDAAHRVTPRGGTGMNTAIASAHDLAWKLAWVRRGWAHRSLLDTYESERRPLAEHNVARSIDPQGSRRAAGDEVAIDLGGRVAHLWQRSADGGRVSTLDLLSDGLTLVTGPDRLPWDVAAAGLDAPGLDAPVPVTVEAVDATGAVALGLGAGGAVLVRPDGRPVALTTRPDDTTGWLARSVDACRGGVPIEAGMPRTARPVSA